MKGIAIYGFQIIASTYEELMDSRRRTVWHLKMKEL